MRSELLGHKADLIMYISIPRRRYGKLQAIREKVSQAHSQPIILSSLILTPEQSMLPLFVQLAKLGLSQAHCEPGQHTVSRPLTSDSESNC